MKRGNEYVTSTTYVKSYHPDNYTANAYNGTASIRDADRFFNGSYTCYPISVKITYNVQGDITSKVVTSLSKNDSTQRIEKLNAKDKWNFGSKTQVFGDYGGGFISNIQPNYVDTTK